MQKGPRSWEGTSWASILVGSVQARDRDFSKAPELGGQEREAALAPARGPDSSTSACQVVPAGEGLPTAHWVAGAQQVPGLWISRELWTPPGSEQTPSLQAAVAGQPSGPSGFNKGQSGTGKEAQRQRGC